MGIDKTSFTGSLVEIGRFVAKAAAESNLKLVKLELGGRVRILSSITRIWSRRSSGLMSGFTVMLVKVRGLVLSWVVSGR